MPESSETRTKEKRKKIPRTLIAYSAGILDSDGCITGSHSENYGNVKVAVVPFTGNDIALAEWLQSMWGGLIHLSHKERPNRPPVYLLELRKEEAIRYLKLVKPFLRTKRHQAECALAYHSLPVVAPAKRRRLVEKIQELNKRFRTETASRYSPTAARADGDITV